MWKYVMMSAFFMQLYIQHRRCVPAGLGGFRTIMQYS